VRAVFGSVPCPANYGFIGTRPVWSRRQCEGECLASIDPEHVLAAARDLLASRFAMESDEPKHPSPHTRAVSADSSLRSG
jgi:hypothetical protein